MPVYVDELQVYPNARGIFRAGSCHMAADTLEELHDMARKIGMRLAWFQNKNGRHPHYDLVKSRRDRAIALGAKEVTGRDLIMMWRRLRGESGPIDEDEVPRRADDGEV